MNWILSRSVRRAGYLDPTDYESDIRPTSDYVRAGAVALGIGTDLIHQDAIKHRNQSWIRELARRYTNIVTETRQEHSQ